MTIQAFIFDLDGVLTDTAEYHYRAWKRLADEEDIPFNRQDNEALRGVSRRESLNLILQGRKISEQMAQEWMERKNQYYVEMIGQMTPAEVLPGVSWFLEAIHQAGLRCAIASASKNAAEVTDRIGLRPYIDVMCDGSSVVNSKPAPDLFLLAAQQLEVPPEQCVVVEDAAAGIQAAKAGGMLVIGVGPEERVRGADMIVPDLGSLNLKTILRTLQPAIS